MNDLPSIEDRVSKGICWLEERGAYDWAEKIVAAVDASKFYMDISCSCAVGTALGDYVRDFYLPMAESKQDPAAEGERLGFYLAASEGSTVAESKLLYAPLEAEWERAARRHAAYRVEVLAE